MASSGGEQALMSGGGLACGMCVCVRARVREGLLRPSSPAARHVAIWRSYMYFCPAYVAFPIDLAGARLRGAA